MTPEEILSQRRAVITEALSWIGTPYIHGAQLKGVGVSCSSFIAAAFNMVLGTNLYVVDHPEQWFMNSKKQLYLDNLNVQGFVEVPQSEVHAGDLVVSCAIYEVYCHSGLLLNWPTPPTVIHVSVNGCEKINSMWSTWYYTQKRDANRFFSWGGWH